MATRAISTTETNVIPVEKPIMRDATERTLVQRAQEGDEEAFATLFRLHKRRVFSVCLQMTNDVAEAEDITQEAFLQVFCKLRTFRGEAAFSTWLHRIAVNTVLMKLRRCKFPPTLSLDEPAEPDSPSWWRELGKKDPNLSGAVDRILLHRAIRELPAGCRKIFGLHAVHGYQHHEIAKLLNCSVGNSKSQLHKAKMKMRELLHPKLRRVHLQNAAGKKGERSAMSMTNNRSISSAQALRIA